MKSILTLILILVAVVGMGQTKPNSDTTRSLFGKNVSTTSKLLLSYGNTAVGTFNTFHYYGMVVMAPNPKSEWTKNVNYQFFVLRSNSGKDVMKVGLPDTDARVKIIVDIRRIKFVNDTTIIIDKLK